MPNPELVDMAKMCAVQHGLHDVLICAIVEQESGWDSLALRYEPAFYERYIVPLGLQSEVLGKARATSWGLMQVMLESVFEIGYNGDGPGLQEPAMGLEWGCRLFAKKLLRANGDPHQALVYWNGGGNPLYPGQVIDRMPHYITTEGPQTFLDEI